MKNKAIPLNLLQDFSDYISMYLGLYYSKENLKELEKKILTISSELSYDNPINCVEWLIKSTSTEKIHLLAKHLTVGETYFFRDNNIFSLLEKEIFPSLIREREKEGKKTIRIWSAGCCSGEEPYSIAILLKEMIPLINDWEITIIGSDINPIFLKKAKLGEFQEWSFRATPNRIKNYYFNKLSSRTYEILEGIKKMVQFKEFNLVSDSQIPILEHMDVILCSNVLLYFSPNQIQKVVDIFTSALSIGGSLIVSAIEIPSIKHPYLKMQKFGSTLFFKKELIESIKKDKVISEEKNKKFAKSVKASSKKQIPEFTNFKEEISEKTLKPIHKHVEKKQEVISKIKLAEQNFKKEHYEQVLALFDEDIKNNINLKTDEIVYIIKSFFNLKKMNEALKWCKKGIEADKLNPSLYFLEAQILQELNRFSEAVDALKKTIFLDSNYIFAYFSLGNLLLELKKPKESYKQFKNCLKLAKNFEKNFTVNHEMTIGELEDLVNTLIKNIEKTNETG